MGRPNEGGPSSTKIMVVVIASAVLLFAVSLIAWLSFSLDCLLSQTGNGC